MRDCSESNSTTLVARDPASMPAQIMRVAHYIPTGTGQCERQSGVTCCLKFADTASHVYMMSSEYKLLMVQPWEGTIPMRLRILPVDTSAAVRQGRERRHRMEQLI